MHMINGVHRSRDKVRHVTRRAAHELFILVALAVGLLQGCVSLVTVGPDYTPPETKMPDAWHQAATKGLAEGRADLQTWWVTLNDPVLDNLIRRAGKGNLDLKGAVARILQARASLGIESGQQFPQIDGAGSFERSRTSEGIEVGVPPPQDNPDNFAELELDATWEIDLWGRIKRSIESADAALDASTEDYRDVLVLLFADVATNYVEARTLQARIRLARNNVELQRQTLQLTKDRFKAGISPLLDVRQAELNLATTESSIPPLKSSLAQAINRLGVLLGDYPSTLYAGLAQPVPIPVPPDDVTVGLPAELLRQRPDIRRAERALAAQTAQIGVATADLYPQFSLFGTLGVSAVDAVKFFASGNVTYSFGPQFSWNLFAGGSIRSNIDAQDALTKQALLRYENTVLQAVEETENSMTAYVQERDRRGSLARSVTAAQESVKLVETLYKTGLTDFQNVLDMQRSLFQQQDQLAESEGDVTQNLISIYKALGGGWSP